MLYEEELRRRVRTEQENVNKSGDFESHRRLFIAQLELKNYTEEE